MPAPAAATAVRAVLIGATGRMGLALLRAAPAFAELKITGAIASGGSAHLGRDAGELAGLAPLGVAVTSDLAAALREADVVLDFSRPAAVAAHVAACRAAHRPLLLGVTGCGEELEGELTAAARDIALLVAANTSLGVTLLIELVRTAARALPPTFDIDVLDVHHRAKQDAPSGTALALGAAARAARQPPVPGAGRMSPRSGGEIGFAALRAGDIVGEHSVHFSGPGEQLTLSHRATDRAIFARGALAAALWLESRPPGRYAMADVLALKTGA